MLSLIIPVRDWPQERIDLCISSFSELGSASLSEILIVDFGSRDPVRKSANKLVKLIRVDAETWSLGEAINIGVVNARNDVVAKTDADILITKKSLAGFDRMAEAVQQQAVGLGLVQATDLPPELSPVEAAATIKRGKVTAGRLRPRWGQGGLVFFSRQAWNSIGGFDSRFTGWGNEDNDFAERLRRAGQRIEWADRDAISIFHIWHPPSYAATGVLSQRLKNQQIAKTDKSVFRPLKFRNSDFAKLAAPAIRQSVAPLVTLAIATTGRPNRNRMISEAIDSFKGQLDNDVEVVIVDNGSSDKDARSLKQLASKIKWPLAVRLEAVAEGSIPASRNLITRMARGRYLCVVDDDDIALSNRLADHLRVFSNNGGLHGSHGGWIDFDESTGIFERNQGKDRTIATLLKGTGKITAHPASLYRTDVLRAVPYDENFALGSDFDLALRLANNGFEIAHTNSYLTLRRYHSNNVTITGQANQVSNGVLARSRATQSFSWDKVGGLQQVAKANDGEIYCRNQLSIDSIAELVPGYTGAWQIYVPITTLGINPNGQPAGNAKSGLLDEVLKLIPGDLCTRRSGLNLPVQFRSEEITGLKRARELKHKIEQIVSAPVQINSVRQAQIDRETPFDWKSVTVPPGERMLQSERFGDLTELLNVLALVAPGSLLRSSVSVLADYDEEGEAYYLITTHIKGIDNLRQLEFDLERALTLPFHHIASMGVPSELTPPTRSH